MTDNVHSLVQPDDPRVQAVLQQRAATLSEKLAKAVRKAFSEDKLKWPKYTPQITMRFVDMVAGACVVLASEVYGADDAAFESAFSDLVKLKFAALRDAKKRSRA